MEICYRLCLTSTGDRLVLTVPVKCWKVAFVYWNAKKMREICQKSTKVGTVLRACLHGGGGHQVGEVTRSGGVKNNNPPLHAILQPHYPGVH